MSVITAMRVATPMVNPTTVSTARNLCARMAPAAMRRLSPSEIMAVLRLVEVLFEPADGTVGPVHHVLGFADSVAFARIADHQGIHAHVLERDVILFGFGDGHVAVILAVHQQGR